jgi:hypothetical protein
MNALETAASDSPTKPVGATKPSFGATEPSFVGMSEAPKQPVVHTGNATSAERMSGVRPDTSDLEAKSGRKYSG